MAVVEGNALDVRVDLHFHRLFFVVEQVFDQQRPSALDGHYLGAVHIDCLPVELDLFASGFHAVKIPDKSVAVVCAHIEQALILVGIDGQWQFREPEDLDFPALVHVDNPGLAVVAREADVLLLEGDDVSNGRHVFNLLDEADLLVVPNGHLSVLEGDYQQRVSEEAEGSDWVVVVD